MTVFCALFSDVASGEEPILISDVLLTKGLHHSVDGARYRRTYIPSLGGTFPQVSPEASISGLGQKTYLLNTGGCFSVAGDLPRVLKFYSRLSEDGEARNVIQTCSEYKDDIQFVVFIVDAAAKVLFLCASPDCTLMRPGSYGLVVIGGSGESTMRKLLLQHEERSLQGDSTLAPIARALCLINEALLMDENEPSATLGRRFGAYYELAKYEDGLFVKVGNIIHHYIKFVVGEDVNYWMVRKSYYHEYIGEDLVVRRITFDHEHTEISGWQDCYVIGGMSAPTDGTSAEAHINSFAPAPAWEVVCLEVSGIVFRVVSNRHHLIKISMSEGRWFLSIDEQLARELVDRILALRPHPTTTDSRS